MPARPDDGGVGSWLTAADCTAESDWVALVVDDDGAPDGKSGPADVFTIAGSGMSDGGSVFGCLA